MMMKDLISGNYDISDTGESNIYDDFIRLSPQGLPDYTVHEPYRCPVSTPAGKRRSMKGQPSTFVTFTNLNRSLQIPKHISSPKHSNHKSLQNKRPISKPQKKNFDCYFVEKIDKPAYVDAQMRSTWLSSLCSQPVNEIFGKYKRRSEMSSITPSAIKCRNVTTPGEKALLSAWSSNHSQRTCPSVMTRSIKSGYSAGSTTYSRLSWDEPSLRVYGYDCDPDRMLPTTGFALMPVSPSHQDTTDMSVITSPRGSPVSYKKVKNSNHNAVNEVASSFDESVYYPFQRDQRFPEIKQRKGAYSPTKKSVKSEPIGRTSPSPAVFQKLEESPMQIVSFGSFNNAVAEEPQAKTTVLKQCCKYRLPKNSSSSLPELEGNS